MTSNDGTCIKYEDNYFSLLNISFFVQLQHFIAQAIIIDANI